MTNEEENNEQAMALAAAAATAAAGAAQRRRKFDDVVAATDLIVDHLGTHLPVGEGTKHLVILHLDDLKQQHSKVNVELEDEQLDHALDVDEFTKFKQNHVHILRKLVFKELQTQQRHENEIKQLQLNDEFLEKKDIWFWSTSFAYHIVVANLIYILFLTAKQGVWTDVLHACYCGKVLNCFFKYLLLMATAVLMMDLIVSLKRNVASMLNFVTVVRDRY